VQQWQLLGQAASNTSFAVRDRAMADNLLWVASTAPGARLFAWAHNLHVTRQAPAMGKALAEALGENYRAIAFTFGTGGFSAVGRTNTSIGSLGAFNIPSVSSGTLEALFAESASPRLIFDARRMITAGDAAASLRNQPIPMRAIGATFDPASAAAANFFSPVLLPQDFDAVIWFATTQPSVLLPFVR
jgi:erythromycin esterase